LKYTVGVKGKWAGRRDEPLSFTANEVDERRISKEVELQTERGIEYRYLAYGRGEGGPS